MNPIDTRSDRLCSLAASATRALLRLFSGVWVARVCGEQLFGSFAILLSIETIVFTVAGCLAAAPLANLVPRLAPQSGLRLWRTVARQLSWAGAVVAVVAFLAAFQFTEFGLWASLGAAVSYGVGVQVAVHRAYHASIYRSVRVWEAEAWSFGLPLVIVLVAPSVGLSAWELFWLGSGLGALIACVRLRPRGPAGPRELHPEFWPLGRTMLTGSLAYTAGSRLQVFVLAALAAPAEVGLFAAALSLAGPLRMAGAACGNLLRPRVVQALASGQSQLARRWTHGVVGLLTLVGGVGLIASWLLGEWGVGVLYGGALADLPRVLPFAWIYVTHETIGSVLVVVAQARGTDGARVATRLRCGVAAASVAVIVPACLGGATVALAALAALELVFALGILRDVQSGWALATPALNSRLSQTEAAPSQSQTATAGIALART